MHNAGKRFHPSELRGPPAAFAGDDQIGAQLSTPLDPDWLELALPGERAGKTQERGAVKLLAGLVRVGHDPIAGDLERAGELGRAVIPPVADDGGRGGAVGPVRRPVPRIDALSGVV